MKVAQWLIADLPPTSAAGPLGDQAWSEDASSDDAKYDARRRAGYPPFWDRFVSRTAVLDRYRDLEEWSWTTNVLPRQNVAWLLRAKHEEATLRARNAAFNSALFLILGGAVSLADVVGAVAAWFMIVGMIGFDPRTGDHRVPDHLWMVVVATTGLVLLVGAAAALLFRVAREFNALSARHAHDADRTREIEVAVRLALDSSNADQAMEQIISRLLRHPPDPGGTATEGEIPMLPEVLRELKDLVVAAEKVRR